MIIDHINRYVSNVEAVAAFYTDALGFILMDKGIKKDGHPYAILCGGGIELFISEKKGFQFDTSSNLRHLSFSVESADALLEELKANHFVPRETPLVIKAYSRQFYIKDPDGFELDFIEWTDKDAFYRLMEDKNK